MVSKKDAMIYESLSENVLDIYLSIEYDLLMTIVGLVSKDIESLESNPDLWRAERLKEQGVLRKSGIELIAKTAAITVDELETALINAGIVTLEELDDDLLSYIEDGANIKVPTPIDDSPTVLNILSAVQLQATSSLNLTNATMLRMSTRIYTDMLNETVVSMSLGNITGQQALRKTILKWGEQGIPALIDKKGRKWGTEGYVRTVLTSTMGNTANEVLDQRIQDVGIKLVEVTSHSGARPKCAPYQGKIFALDDNHPKYKNLYSATSYGEPDGLFGINCGHRKYPYIEGITERRFKPYKKEENDRVYKESQVQRKLERNIRKTKTKSALLEKAGDKDGVKRLDDKLKQQQKQMREFINSTGRTRRRDREQIVSTDEKIGQIVSKSKQNLREENKKAQYTKRIKKSLKEL